MKKPALVLLALLILALALAADASAAGGVLGGKLPGLAKLPAKGRVVSVRAVDTATGTVTATATPRGASYALRVPSGQYMVFGAAASTSGRGGALAWSSHSVPVKKGRRSGVKLRTRSKHARHRTHRKHRRKRHGARSARTGLPAIGVSPGTVLRVVPGYPNGLELDATVITGYFAAEPCDKGLPPLVEVRNRQAILDEIELQQSKYFDPRTRVTPHLVDPEAMISGSGTVQNGQITFTLQIAGAMNASVSGSAADTAAGLVGLMDSLVKQLMEKVCDELDPPATTPEPAPESGPAPAPPAGRPAAYAGSASGTVTSSDGLGGTLVTSWTMDDLRYDLLAGSAETRGVYLLAGGTMHVTFSGTYAQCDWTGSGTLSVSPSTGAQGTLDLALPDDNYFLRGYASGYIMTTVDCPEGPPTQIREPAAVEFVRSDADTGRKLPGPGGVLSGSASRAETMLTTEWSWSLHPHA